MHKIQSSTKTNLTLHFVPKDTDNMQPTRRALLNLTSNSLIKSVVKSNVVKLSSKPIKTQNAFVLRKYSSDGKKKQKLLRFPAFPLGETMDKFLVSSQPFLSKEEYKETKELAENFIKDVGCNLQALLEEAAEKEENWLAQRWLRGAYLQYRDPVTVFSSPGMAFPRAVFKCEDDFLKYTARVIFVMIVYKQMIDRGEIPIVKMGENELDNSQFERVFGTIRSPRPNEDCLQYHPDSKHVVVIYKNQFYKLPVITKDCKPMHPCGLKMGLKQIICNESVKACGYGVLTTDNRDDWAKSYQLLIKDPKNKESIDEIEKSLFTVSLDDEVEADKNNEDSVLCGQLIHGGGTNQNSANRWMDKTIQLIVNRNGMCGFTYEHSPAEGQPIALMTDFILNNLQNDKLFSIAASEDYPLKKLPLVTVSGLENKLEGAKCRVNKLAKDLDMELLRFKSFGKNCLKKYKVSPDSFIQMAFQLAFYKIHCEPGAQYESAHLRIYVNGRTETIRSCSNESIAFARAMLDDSSCPAERAELMRKAINGHRAYTMMALKGQGVDRHLFGLKQMAIENKCKIHEFYSSPGFVKSSRFRISTSQVASPLNTFMCYGPLTHDGYSCCYNPRNDDIIVAVGAWHSNKETSAKKFAKTIAESMDFMNETLEAAGPPPEKPKAKL